MTELRTPAEALTFILSTRLRFGAPDQLEALNILRAAEDLIGTQYQCPRCDGTGRSLERGYCSSCGHECEHCDGSTRCKPCEGSGTQVYERGKVYRYPVDFIYKMLKQEKAA